jgi:hypothetical protein
MIFKSDQISISLLEKVRQSVLQLHLASACSSISLSIWLACEITIKRARDFFVSLSEALGIRLGQWIRLFFEVISSDFFVGILLQLADAADFETLKSPDSLPEQ